MKTIVIGAGIIGTLTAYHLARAGHDVTVIERQGGVSLGTSFANAAQLSYTYVEPMADPFLLPKIPQWLFSKNAPVKIHWSVDYAMWKWCVQLLMQCTPKRFAANRDAILKLALYSKEVMDAFLAEHEVAFDYSTTGKLHLYPDEKSFANARKHVGYKQSLGLVQEILNDKDACIAKEPALQHYKGTIRGGVFAPLDATGGTHQFSEALVKVMEGQHYPVTFRFNTECKRIIARGGYVFGVETNNDVLEADNYVVATGPEAGKLLNTTGIRIPIYPLKGYSVTFPLQSPEHAPNISITDHNYKVAYARLGNRMRISGGMELAGFDTACPPERINKFISLINNNFPNLCNSETPVSWAGLRPSTPTGVPIIGQSKRYQNLYVNIGHGMLGWTLAQGSGKILSEIINKKQSVINISPYTCP